MEQIILYCFYFYHPISDLISEKYDSTVRVKILIDSSIIYIPSVRVTWDPKNSIHKYNVTQKPIHDKTYSDISK